MKKSVKVKKKCSPVATKILESNFLLLNCQMLDFYNYAKFLAVVVVSKKTYQFRIHAKQNNKLPPCDGTSKCKAKQQFVCDCVCSGTGKSRLPVLCFDCLPFYSYIFACKYCVFQKFLHF